MIERLTIVEENALPIWVETIIDEYWDEELVELLYENYEGPREDIGGGIQSINAVDVVSFYEDNPHKMRIDLKIGTNRARDFLEWARKKIQTEEYY